MLTNRSSLALALLFVVMLPGCFTGSGRLEDRSFAVEGFDAVSASRYVSVDVRHGDAFAVEVTADDNLWPHLHVRREGSELVVTLSDAYATYQDVTVHAVVTMPSLTALSLSGGARGTIDGFPTLSALRVHGSGGSVVEGSADALDLRVELSGGSHATLDGTSEALSLDASGGSAAELLDLSARAVSVSLSGGSHGVVTASERLDYHLSGDSHLDYAGNPTLGTQELSGGADVAQR